MIRRASFEALEHRRMLHAGHVHDADDLIGQPGYQLADHMMASEFVRLHPEFKGKDLWNASTFDPKGTRDTAQFIYDPHMVVDERPVQQQTPWLNAAAVTALPDIVPLTGNGFLAPYIDTTEIPGRNLMRFSTAVGNMGAGPIALTSSNGAVDAQGRQIITQNVYKYDSATHSFGFDYAREAGRFIWHNGHGHFHFEGYARYRLLQNNGGSPGAVAMRSDGSQAIGDKVGFCLINILDSFTYNGTDSTTIPSYGGSGQPFNGCGFQQGISVGWADVYDSIYDGQWIDVTGVPNGNYFLEVTLDADNAVQETNDANNTVFVPYTLNVSPPAGGIQPDRFEPNNTFATATNLGEAGVQTQAGLTIHTSHEADYFRFTAASSGPSSVQAIVGDRDVNLYLYDSNQNLLGQSTSANTGPMTETVNYANFVKGQTYYVLAQGFGSDFGTSGVSSSFAVKINVNPTVDTSAPTPTATLGSPGVIRVMRNGPTSSPLTVNLTYSGTATAGVDYDALPSSVIIGNEASFVDIPVTVKPGANLGAGETVIANVSGSSAYAIGTNGATVNLIDNVAPANVAQNFSYNTVPQAIRFTFSESVQNSLAAGDLTLTNLTTSGTIAAGGVAWDGATNTASFTFNSGLPSGSFNAVVAAANVSDSSGNPLSSNATYNFIWVSGSNANDVVRVDLDSGATNVRAYNNSASPSYVADAATLNGIFIAGGDGADTLIVDGVNGTIDPTGQFVFDGGNNTDTLSVLGSSGAQTIAFNASNVTIGGSQVEHTAIEAVAFDGKGGLDTVAVNAGPMVTMSATQNLQSLTIANGASARLTGGANVVIVTRALAINGTGQLDLTNSSLIVDYSGGSQLSAVQSLINAARAGGAWTGGGLTSTNAKNANPKNTTLAAIEASDFKTIYGPAATFAGQSIDTSAVLVKYTYYGDADFNGQVNFDDYARIDNGFSSGTGGWMNGDFDGNGTINFDDYSLIDLAFNTQGAPLVLQSASKPGRGTSRS